MLGIVFTNGFLNLTLVCYIILWPSKFYLYNFNAHLILITIQFKWTSYKLTIHQMNLSLCFFLTLLFLLTLEHSAWLLFMGNADCDLHITNRLNECDLIREPHFFGLFSSHCLLCDLHILLRHICSGFVMLFWCVM